MSVQRNICIRDESSLRLSITLYPVAVCSSTNSYWSLSIVEHMSIVIVCITNAAWLLTKRHSIIGTMANGNMKTFVCPSDDIIPTMMGKTEAVSMLNTNLYALCTTSGWYSSR